MMVRVVVDSESILLTLGTKQENTHRMLNTSPSHYCVNQIVTTPVKSISVPVYSV